MKFNAIVTVHAREWTWEQKNQMSAVLISVIEPVYDTIAGGHTEMTAIENKEHDVHIGHWIIE